ncbi:MAG: DEAD/DEAH box helicase [Lentisphaerae bacterium]|nr:DEAD/DEAH box helicase [Lentisphaerota bacterium]MCP4100638.1 DEAD/DEAH box helicase [Lentisphaerota bacterium]
MIKALGNRIKNLFGRKNNDKLVENATTRKTSGSRKSTAQEKSSTSSRRKENNKKLDDSRNYNSKNNNKRRRKKVRSDNFNNDIKKPIHEPKSKKIPAKPEKLIVPPEEEGKTRFSDLDVQEDILFGLQKMEFQYCTPIQAKSLPHLLEGKDLTGKAQTGTGKTAAFLVSTFNRLLKTPKQHPVKGSCRALVLAPTRELALQIYKDAENISMYTGLYNVVVFGGMDHRKQRENLNRPIDVLIGTPGRIIDYSRSRHLNLSQTEILVIDEADRMLDMGFIPDVRRILNQLPGKGKRQTLFYSATLEDRILRLSDSWLSDPVSVESESGQMVTDLIEQKFYTVAASEKFPLLMWMIKNEKFDRMLIFGNRKDKNFELYDNLKRHGVPCALLSGDIPQVKRLKILERFRSGKEKIVIATDVAARGIHVDNVSVVVNYDMPERSEDYVHRVGRTGRAGQKGISASFVCEYGAYYLPEIEKLLGEEIKCVLPPEEMLETPELPPNAPPPRSAKSRGRSSGGGRSGSGNRSGGRRPYKGRR